MYVSCFLGELVDVFGKKAVSAEAGADIEVELAAFVSVANSKIGTENCAESFSEGISVITKASTEVGIQAFVEAVSEDSSAVFSEDGFEVIRVEIVFEEVFEANFEDNSDVVAEAFPVVVIAPVTRWIEIGRSDDL